MFLVVLFVVRFNEVYVCRYSVTMACSVDGLRRRHSRPEKSFCKNSLFQLPVGRLDKLVDQFLFVSFAG